MVLDSTSKHPQPTRHARPVMKAVRFHDYGDADVLRYEDVEQPVPGAGEVRLHVAATTFNPVDDGIRGGYLQGPFPVTLPHIPGIEVAGTVDSVGEGVENVAAGGGGGGGAERRAAGRGVRASLRRPAAGAAAEYAIAPAETLAPAPTTIPLI